jgi:hypothetical protein
MNANAMQSIVYFPPSASIPPLMPSSCPPHPTLQFSFLSSPYHYNPYHIILLLLLLWVCHLHDNLLCISKSRKQKRAPGFLYL